MEQKNNKLYFLIGVIIVGIVLFVGIIVVLKDKVILDKSKLEYQLIKEGKTTSSLTTVQQFAEALHSGNISEAKSYLASDCVIYGKNNKKCTFEEYISNIDTSTSYRYEKRGSSIKDEDTYRISWNEGKEIQTIILRKVITKERVYYEIVECILTVNKV